ncbi:MAG: YajQ family cyclic di-GMP-binding protein [Betaproteobacteria bacterium]
MPSFDIVSDINKVELRNALDQTNKEVGNRFDFKGTDARIEQKELELTVYADSTFQLQQVMDVLRTKCAKRGVDMRSFEPEEPEKIGGDKMKQLVKVKEGIEQELGKKIVKAIKDAKLKVQASIQGNAVRVSGAKKDELQEAMALVRKTVSEVPVQFNNFRD